MHNPETILFVVNPVAGGKGKGEWETAIRGYFDDKPQTIHFFEQTGEGDKSAIQQRIDELKPQKVVAVGGDGTVKLVAELVKETAMALGIVPAGSANGLAKELELPTDTHAVLQTIAEGRTGKLDAIRINEEELCFHLADIGLNALLVKYFEAGKGRGMWGYARSLLKMFWNKRLMRVAIETDSGTVKRKAFMVALANAEKYGTGAVINPHGKVDDGKFEIVVVRRINLVQVLKAVAAHKNFDPKSIEVFRTTNVSITLQQKAPFQVDGEYMGKTAKLTARMQAGMVNVLLPNPQTP